jgi:hypothetical protein
MKVTKSGGVMYIEYGDQRLMLVSKFVNSIQVSKQEYPDPVRPGLATLTVVQVYNGIDHPVLTTVTLANIEDAQLLYKEILRANHLGEFETEEETSRILH